MIEERQQHLNRRKLSIPRVVTVPNQYYVKCSPLPSNWPSSSSTRDTQRSGRTALTPARWSVTVSIRGAVTRRTFTAPRSLMVWAVRIGEFVVLRWRVLVRRRRVGLCTISVHMAYRGFFLPRMHLVGVCVYPRHDWSAHPCTTIAFLLSQGCGVEAIKVDARICFLLQHVAISFEYFFCGDVRVVLEYLIVIENRLDVFRNLRPFSLRCLDRQTERNSLHTSDHCSQSTCSPLR